MPYAQRRYGINIVPGAQTSAYGSDSTSAQNIEGPARNVLALGDAGKLVNDMTQIAAGQALSLPLPATYDPTKRLMVLIVCDQTCKLTVVQPVLGTAQVMIRAGLASDQQGLTSFCGQVSSLTVTNPTAVAMNVEFMLLELPDITVNAGWRDGMLSTGLSAP